MSIKSYPKIEIPSDEEQKEEAVSLKTPSNDFTFVLNTTKLQIMRNLAQLEVPNDPRIYLLTQFAISLIPDIDLRLKLSRKLKTELGDADFNLDTINICIGVLGILSDYTQISTSQIIEYLEGEL
ncbi:MAG: hypothetical protein M0R51_17770 [Clostridia bacterium]|jgi:hypothetical protein|nr:hypothetical protein [Clostridia bacterium]